VKLIEAAIPEESPTRVPFPIPEGGRVGDAAFPRIITVLGLLARS
jgi:hypothetical protein